MAGALKQTNRHMAEDYSAESTLEGTQDRGALTNPIMRRGSQSRAKDQHTRQETETIEGSNHGDKGWMKQWTERTGTLRTGNHHSTT